MKDQITDLATRLGNGRGHEFAKDFSAQIRGGQDPLGDHYSAAVPADERRINGATFTPLWMVELMIEKVARTCTPDRVVDAGSGSGRYAMAAARRWPSAKVIAVEKNPLLAEAIRVNATTARLGIEVICGDFLAITLPKIDGVTAYIGNPPYIRHHDINALTKRWYADRMGEYHLNPSQLAGLQVYFFLKSFALGHIGDIGCFITSAEWTETSYGAGMRSLFCKMGGSCITRVNPSESIFTDALTTSIIASWKIGFDGPVVVEDLAGKSAKQAFVVEKSELKDARKWPGFGHRCLSGEVASGPVLGDYFRISRGQVTGMNDIWIANADTEKLIPERYLLPCVTHAKELISAGAVLNDSIKLRRVINLPGDLSELTRTERKKVDRFLEIAKARGADKTYVAEHRTPWWKVSLKEPPAAIMTYMGRRPPVFVRNACKAALINVAHALYPKQKLSIPELDAIIIWLNANVQVAAGRTYGGGLVKFEPKEAMRIQIPGGAPFSTAA